MDPKQNRPVPRKKNVPAAREPEEEARDSEQVLSALKTHTTQALRPRYVLQEVRTPAEEEA